MNQHATTPRLIASSETRTPATLQQTSQGLLGWVRERFEFPGGEFAIVTAKGEKISLPTPLLAALVALFIWMAGGTLTGVYLAGRMSATVDNLGNTFTQYQIRAEADKKAEADRMNTELKSLRERNELLDLKLADLREKQAAMAARRN